MMGFHNNPEQADVTAYVALDDGLVAHKYGILGTDYVCYVLLVESQDMTGFSTFYSCRERHGDYPGFDGWLGAYTTAHLPDAASSLPFGSAERIALVDHYFTFLKQNEALYLQQAFPHDFAAQEKGGGVAHDARI